MTLKELKDFTKQNLKGFDGSFYIGKIDRQKEKALCFYPAQASAAKTGAVGGKKNSSYILRNITVILRYGKNADEAEKTALLIQDFFDEKTFLINKKRVFCISRYSEPVSLGTDERNVHEYSFLFDFYLIK